MEQGYIQRPVIATPIVQTDELIGRKNHSEIVKQKMARIIPPCVAFVFCLLLLLFNKGVSAQVTLIENVAQNFYQDRVEIIITFSDSIQTVTHSPRSAGRELQVRLRPIRTTPLFNEIGRGEQVVNLKSGFSEYVREISYELRGDAGVSISPIDIRLIVKFGAKERYSVRSGRDQKSVVISIDNRDQGRSVTSPSTVVADGPATSPGEPVKTTGNRQVSTSSGEPRGIGKAAPVSEKKSMPVGNYAINLSSTVQPVDLREIDRNPLFDQYVLYTTSLELEGRLWHRLRLGFFKSAAEANRVKTQLQAVYPRLWVTRVPQLEIAHASGSQLIPGGTIRPGPTPGPGMANTGKQPRDSDSSVEGLMQQAREAMLARNFLQAIQLYRKVLQLPGHVSLPIAQEFLGLAYERNKQFTAARAEYQRYLKLYPKGEGAGRVKQRLVALLNVRNKVVSTPATPVTPGAAEEDDIEWITFGSFSQFYRRDADITDTEGELINNSSLATDIDYSARRLSADYDLRARFTGGYVHDFLPSSTGEDITISSMYFDFAQRTLGLSGRIGRQSGNTGGLFGRFDGAQLGYRLNSNTKLNLVSGLPVRSSFDSLSTDRVFVGASVNLGTYANAWDFVLYAISQDVDGFTDRRAVGGEFHYSVPDRSLFGMVDYDIFFDELNIFSMFGTWTLPGEYTLNANYSNRKVPFLTTSNAWSSTGDTVIGELLNTMTMDQITQLARERTATSSTLTLGLSHSLTGKLQLSGDVTWSDLTSVDNPDGDDGQIAEPGTGINTFYNLQLIGSSLVKDGDIAILGLKYADTQIEQTTSLSMNTRYPINSAWRVNPRVRIDYSTNSLLNSTGWTLAPSFQMDYNWDTRYSFEFDIGGEWVQTDSSLGRDESLNYFFFGGYRIDF